MNAPIPPVVDVNMALGHLQYLDPNGVHQVAAINTDAGVKAFVTFLLDEEGKSRAIPFLKRYGGSCNIYYSANEVRPDLGDKRAKKSDILNIRMIGADLDPPKGIQLMPDALKREHKKLDDIRERVSLEPEAFYNSP